MQHPEIYSHKYHEMGKIMQITLTSYDQGFSTWTDIKEVTPCIDLIPWEYILKIVQVFGWQDLGKYGFDTMSKQYNAWCRKHNLQNLQPKEV